MLPVECSEGDSFVGVANLSPPAGTVVSEHQVICTPATCARRCGNENDPARRRDGEIVRQHHHIILHVPDYVDAHHQIDFRPVVRLNGVGHRSRPCCSAHSGWRSGSAPATSLSDGNVAMAAGTIVVPVPTSTLARSDVDDVRRASLSTESFDWQSHCFSRSISAGSLRSTSVSVPPERTMSVATFELQEPVDFLTLRSFHSAAGMLRHRAFLRTCRALTGRCRCARHAHAASRSVQLFCCTPRRCSRPRVRTLARRRSASALSFATCRVFSRLTCRECSPFSVPVRCVEFTVCSDRSAVRTHRRPVGPAELFSVDVRGSSV